MPESISPKTIKQSIQHYLATGELPQTITQDGTPFQKRVWKELKRIPFGKTMTYQEIANRIGKPKAVRAVANAIGKNLNIIHIPCHRVIRSNGSMGGFAFGVKLKHALLAFEQQAKPRSRKR